jgi:hypothetical protein
MRVPSAVQQVVHERARGRCEYCHSLEWVRAARFTLNHRLRGQEIVPDRMGVRTRMRLDMLTICAERWRLPCRCSSYGGQATHGRDTERAKRRRTASGS